VVIDILAPDGDQRATPLERFFRLFERGGHIRRHRDHLRLLGASFDVMRTEPMRSHLFSMAGSPLYTNLRIYLCRPRTAAQTVTAASGTREHAGNPAPVA
jgi:hypothetical protein